MRTLYGALSAALAAALVFGCARSESSRAATWRPDSAASYLDRRADWWMGWREAVRDHDTYCVSCHTTLPYALVRPALRERSGDARVSAREDALLESVRARVRRWPEVRPYYGARDRQSPKAVASRATEAILNALILAGADAQTGRLSDDTRLAFDHMWTLQRADGPDAGAWPWLQFHLEPWEGEFGEYYGAVLAALAMARAPDHYASRPAIQPNVVRLRAYLDRAFAAQPLSNRAALLWASGTLPLLVPDGRRAGIAADLRAAQQRDGGWSLRGLNRPIRWWDPRRLAWRSDGYATGLAVLALDAASEDNDPTVTRGIAWLASHQDATDGSWPGYSLNRLEPATPGIAQFMNDAATAYAALALVEAQRHVK